MDENKLKWNKKKTKTSVCLNKLPKYNSIEGESEKSFKPQFKRAESAGLPQIAWELLQTLSAASPCSVSILPGHSWPCGLVAKTWLPFLLLCRI